MRSARLQGQDLGRANQFVGTLLSKNDIKELEKPEAPEPPKPQMHMMNGSLPFRPDPKARFSEPPAPPPQQPLPEKPNVPPLKRGLTERQKQQPGSPAEGLSPIRQENTSQIIQLTDALNSAKRDIDTQTNRMKELESLLREERERREQAEGLAKRLEETSAATTLVNGTADAAATLPKSDVDNDTDSATRDAAVEEPAAAKVDSAAAATEATLQAHIDMMEDQVKGLRSQVEEWKQRAEAAEAERDADRKTLAEMVTQLREEQAQRAAAEAQRQSRSRSRKRSASKSALTQADHPTLPSQDDEQADAEKRSVPNHVDGAATAATSTSATAAAAAAGTASDGQDVKAPSWPVPPGSTTTSLSAGHRAVQVQGGMPYASALGVVLLGMGLMAYLNGQGARPE